jgi:transposase
MHNCMNVGADVHEESIVIQWAVNRNKPNKRYFGNTIEGRAKLIDFLKAQARELDVKEIHLAYEACCLGYGLCDELMEAGIKCHVLAPTCMERSPKHVRTKTDEKDAERILEVLRGHVLGGNKLPEIWVPDLQTREDRKVLRRQQALTQSITRIKARATMLLKERSVRRPKGQTPWTKKDREWLANLSAEQFGYGAVLNMESFLRELKWTEGELAVQNGHIQALARSDRYREAVARLKRIKGVGILTAMIFLTEAGDLSRFHNRRTISAYFGLVPDCNESGKVQDRKGHITKQGSPRVRRVLCQAVWTKLRVDPDAAAMHARIARDDPKRKKIATVALMRHLAIEMWRKGREAQQESRAFERPADGAPAGMTFVPARDCSCGVKDTTRLAARSSLTPARGERAPGKPS